MAFPFRRILCPIDFDGNAGNALTLAGHIARQNDGTVRVLHVVALVLVPGDVPINLDVLNADQGAAARERLSELAAKHLTGANYEVAADTGDIPSTIIRAAKQFAADVMVMATHGRRGFSRAILGSVAEMVLRNATCPVITIRAPLSDKDAVGHWMTQNPITASPNEKLLSVKTRMQASGCEIVPVLDDGKLVGILRRPDIQAHAGQLDQIEVRQAMSNDFATVTPATPVGEAARLLKERKVSAIPVMEGKELIGTISSTELESH